MADKSQMTVMVSGNKPRLSVKYEGERLVVDCAKCFAGFLQQCLRAVEKKPNRATGQPYEMPSLASADCQGFHGHATFPKEAYDVIVAHANRKDGDPLIDIPLSLQAGVKTETPIPTSQADIEAVAKKAVADALAKHAAVQAAPLDPALVGDDRQFGELEGNEPTLDEILADDDKAMDDEFGPPKDVIRRDDDGAIKTAPEKVPLINASKRAKDLAKRHGIDLATLAPNVAGKITVVAVRKAVEAKESG